MMKKGEKDSSIQPEGAQAIDINRKAREELESIFDYLSEKYGIDYEVMRSIIDAKSKESSHAIPASVFKDRTESITALAFLYLKHHRQMQPDAISGVLHLKKHTAKKLAAKAAKKLDVNSSFFIPAHVFGKELSPFESIVEYLREHKRLKNHEIAKLLQRSDKTIWTAYNRAKNKEFSLKQGDKQ